MKTYYLRLVNEDFTKTGSVWLSGVIDLYDNESILTEMATPSYRNFSTVKNSAGLDSIGDLTWVGLEEATPGATPTSTDSGEIVLDPYPRFVDTSGRIDIINWDIDISNTLGNEILYPLLTVYTIDDPDQPFPSGWARRYQTAQHEPIMQIDSKRYAKFELDFQTIQDLSDADVELYVKVTIDPPVMGEPFYRRTKQMLDMFPQWMDLRETDLDASSAAAITTPESLGGQFLNAVAGQWLDDLFSDISVLKLEQFINTADVTQADWIYRVDNIPDYIVRVEGDGIELSRAFSKEDFFALSSDADAFWWDEQYQYIYTRKRYTDLQINWQTVTQQLNHNWNWFDEFGSRVDLKRLWNEGNDSYKKRILDVYRNFPGVGLENFKLALRRELNLWLEWGATPNSDYLGATPEVLELEDLLRDHLYTSPDGLPTERFIRLVEYLSEMWPVTWGYFRWDQALWDVGGLDNEGFNVLPFRYDATPLSDDDTLSGVGDGSDLYIYRPDVVTGPRECEINLKMRGFQRAPRTEYRQVTFDVEVWGIADRVAYQNPPVSHWFTVGANQTGSFTLDDPVRGALDNTFYLLAGDSGGVSTYYQTFQLTAGSNINVDLSTPSEESGVYHQLFYPDTGEAVESLVWYDINGNAYSASPVGSDSGTVPNTLRLPLNYNNLGDLTLHAERFSFDLATPAFENNYPLQDDYTAWFVETPEDILRYPATTLVNAPNFIITDSFNRDNDALDLGSTSSSSWSNEAGVFGIESLEAKVGTGALPAIAVFDGGGHDGYYQFEIGSSYADEYGVVFRYVDLVNYNYLAWNAGSAEWELHSVNETATPSDTLVTSWSGSIATGKIVTIVFSGTSVEVYYDGTSLGTATVTDNLTGSKYGLYQGGGTNSTTWENLEAEIYQIDQTAKSHGVMMVSRYAPSASGEWQSEPVTYRIVVNGVVPDESEKSFVMPAPIIDWDPYVTGTKKYRVRIKTTENDVRGGVFDSDLDEFGVTNALLPSDYIYLNASNTWDATEGWMELDYVATTQFEFTVGTSASPQYPVSNPNGWTAVSFDLLNPISAVVDENGPWRNNLPPVIGNTNFNLTTLNLTRDDFGIPDTDDYAITWVGVEVTGGDSRVVTWLDTNTVKPAIQTAILREYPTNCIDEYFDTYTQEYGFSPITIKLRLLPGPDSEWHPQINSGWFYDRNDEYYLYARPSRETATITSDSWVLGNVSRQGAPIIVWTDEATPVPYRQIANWDSNTESYTLRVTQTVYGNNTEFLYLAYEDIYDVEVTNLNLGTTVSADTESEAHYIHVNETTDYDTAYEVSYLVRNSFFANHEYVDANGEYHTELVFDTALATPVLIDYETSIFDPATPVDVPLNTFYTVVDEGFLFLSHNEYNLTEVEVTMSPSTILADGYDYSVITVRSIDEHGNPKPNQVFTLSTSFGSISPTTITTDNDGFGVATLTSASSTTVVEGTLTVANPALSVSAELSFGISPAITKEPRVVSLVNAPALPADGLSAVWVYGKVEDANLDPVPYATVYWRKARYMYDAFGLAQSEDTATPGQSKSTGAVIADSRGIFEIGPFVTQDSATPGYWFVVTESDHSTPPATPSSWNVVGDVVAWLEYPDQQAGVENANLTPIQAQQWNEWVSSIPGYSARGINTFPSTWDDADPAEPATPITTDWQPPRWYAIQRYYQYQLGLLGATPNTVNYSLYLNSNPDFKEF